jgi:hypothetical protein
MECCGWKDGWEDGVGLVLAVDCAMLGSRGRMIHLSFDQDWAPDWAVEAIHQRLQNAALGATFFATHASPVLDVLRQGELLELGGHPNFLPGSSHGDSVDDVLAYIQALVPEATGVRAHCLIQGTPQLEAYAAKGIQYDASNLRDGEAGLAPFVNWAGVVEIPIWFEDDVHLRRGSACTLDTLDLDSKGLKVFNFHPVLIALNATRLQDYEALKGNLSREGIRLTDATPEDFDPHTQTIEAGVGDLFDAVVSFLEEHPHRCGGPLRRLVG